MILVIDRTRKRLMIILVYNMGKNLHIFLHSSSIVVDPTNLSDGLHYYEVYGIDSKAPWRGPLFRIPVTITKPSIVTSRPPLISFQGISFVPGDYHSANLLVQFVLCISSMSLL